MTPEQIVEKLAKYAILSDGELSFRVEGEKTFFRWTFTHKGKEGYTEVQSPLEDFSGEDGEMIFDFTAKVLVKERELLLKKYA